MYKIKYWIINNRNFRRIYWKIKNIKLENSIKKEIKGKNNKIEYGSLVKLDNCVFDISGNNNTIIINDMCEFNNVTFYIRGNQNTINISTQVIFVRSGELWIEDDNCEITINKKSTFEQVHLAATESGSKIIIGEDCMFSNDIDVRTGDSHAIVDALSNKRINYAKNVIIGNHVWIGAHCSILKGAEIPANSIVATRSVVTKRFNQSGIIVGGLPASIIKENINWNRQRIG